MWQQPLRTVWNQSINSVWQKVRKANVNKGDIASLVPLANRANRLIFFRQFSTAFVFLESTWSGAEESVLFVLHSYLVFEKFFSPLSPHICR